MRLLRRLVVALLLAASVPAAARANDVTMSLPTLVQEVLPSVVTIRASGVVVLSAGMPGAEQTSARGGPRPAPPTTTQRSLSVGSGFVIDSSLGLIVTNNHVIDGADAISVTLQDGTVLQAHLVGRDLPTDLALLHVDSDVPPAVQFGDSSQAVLGEPVFAIGNPFGVGTSVTSGIISALARDIQEGPYDSFIQTDAPINRGNSGGPLFDMTGRVIGVNSAIYTPSGGSVGISFAIPANMARMVIEQLRQHGYVPRAWLGAGVQQLDSTFAESLGLDIDEGAIVASVSPGSPASRAGLRNGDVLLSFDGMTLTDGSQLSRLVAMASVGPPHELVVWHNGNQVTIPVVLAMQPHQAQAPRVVNERLGKMQAYADLGLTLAPLDDAARRARGLVPGDGGVLVTAVAPDSFSAERGVRPGDVILNVGQQVVGTPQLAWQMVARLRQQQRMWVLLLVQNGGGQRWVSIPDMMPDSQ